MLKCCAMSMMLLGLTAGTTGCFSTTRMVQKTQAPDVYRSTSVENLEKALSDRDAGMKTLNLQVLVTASIGGSREGKVTEITPFKGYIFVQKPSNVRVILSIPVLGSRALDVVGDADNFTLVHATAGHGDVWMTGTNVVKTPSKNGLENLRPPIFLDSLMVPGVKDTEYVSLEESTRVLQPATKHQPAVEEPDYDLTISKTVTDHILKPVRVVHISRVNMLPFQQDIYDDHGQIVTQAIYDAYQAYGTEQFPTVITIKRPLDEYTLKINVTKLTLNQPFDSDQFELKIPPDVKVTKME
jgi:outer membrane lipoprotein-sorting protein